MKRLSLITALLIITFTMAKFNCFKVYANTVMASFYVSVSGSDSNPGTSFAPFRTIEKAKAAVRAINSNMTGDIVVYISQGDYLLSQNLKFTNQDSGTNGYKIIYKNKDGLSSARIIGGEKLKNFTRLEDSNIYKSYVGKDLKIINIYENEKTGRAARYPNHEPDEDYPSNHSGYLISEETGAITDFIKYNENDLNPGYFSAFPLSDAGRLMWWSYGGYPDWGIDIKDISSIDADVSKRKINMAVPYALSSYEGQDRYFIQGIFELLDAPGELYYNADEGYLYYWPFDGDPNNSEILLPKLFDIINITGSSVGSMVRNLVFEGLYFTATTFTDSISGGGGFTMSHTEYITIKDCHFKNIGGRAVVMWGDNQYNTVSGCWIEHMGSGGIFIRNNLKRDTNPNNKSQYNLVTNCKIQDFTDLTCTSTNSGGVTFYNASDNEMSFCEIFNSARYAFSVRGHYTTQGGVYDNGLHYAKGNTVKYMKLYRLGSDSGDMGGIHMAMLNPTGGDNINYFNQITLDGETTRPSCQDVKPYGLYADHQYSSQEQVFSNIQITNIQGEKARFNGNPSQSITNVNWTGTFDEALMEYDKIGLTKDFPPEYKVSSTTPTAAPIQAVYPGEIIVDNSDSGYSEQGAGWSTSNAGFLYGGTGRYNNTKSASAKAIWTPNIPTAGLYDVYVWKLANDASANAAVKFYVNSLEKSFLYSVNQTKIPNRWEKLGRHYFDKGTNGNVTMQCDIQLRVTPGGARADAVKFVPVLPSGESLYCSFNEKTGTTFFDETLNFGNGTLFGAASYNNLTGLFGSSLALNGQSSYGAVQSSAQTNIATGDFTASVWFKKQGADTGDKAIISKGEEDLNSYEISASATSLTATVKISGRQYTLKGIHKGADKWNHVAISLKRNANLSLFVNGKCVDTADISLESTKDITNASSLYIGKKADNYFIGEIDDLRLYKKALSLREIKALYAFDMCNLDVVTADNISIYSGENKIYTILEEGGQHTFKATYTNLSKNSKTVKAVFVMTSNNRTIGIKMFDKTFTADETYTFSGLFSIPGKALAPNIKVKAILLKDMQNIIPVSRNLEILR